MKSTVTDKPFPVTDEDWEALIARAPERVDDPECGYDPNDLDAVERAWHNATVRYPGQRGPQKAPTKQAVNIRLSPEVLAHFKATGKGWQTRIDEALKEWIAQHG